MSKEQRLQVIQGLFPGHPARRLLYKSKDPETGKKETVTIHRGAQREDYLQHLSVGTYDGPGALGLFPGYPENPGKKGSRWLVSWLGADFDDKSPKDLMPLVDILEEYDVHPYLTQGTTGRGGHLYIFLSEPLPQPTANEVLKIISNLAQRLGLPTPEIKPSNPYKPGTGIFLPYRGAEKDGYGFNPLIDPVDGHAILLDEIDHQVSRTTLTDLKLLMQEEAIEDPGSGSYEEYHDPQRETTDLEPWEAELQRLRSEWEETKRQDLAMGATAYGLVLGIPPDKVREDLLTLAEQAEDPEIEKRREAIDRTISKHAKGERVAWRPYYKEHGLKPPRIKGPSSEVLVELEFLKAKSTERTWKGKAGLSNRDVYLSLVEAAEAHGTRHERGPEISISVRDLALRASVSKTTTVEALKRLEGQGLIKRSSRGKGIESGSLVLVVDRDALDAYQQSSEKQDQQDPNPVLPPRLRYGPRKLGKLPGIILEVVLRSSGPLTRAEIAETLTTARAGI